MTEAQQSIYQLLLMTGRTEEAEEYRIKCTGGQNISESTGGNSNERNGN